MKGKQFLKWFAVFFLGACGGGVAFALAHLIRPLDTSKLSDSVSVANTYIVFTTFFFVGITVLIGLAAILFTQQFSLSKETQLQQLVSELEGQIKTNRNDVSVKFLSEAFSNADFINSFEETLKSRVKELIERIENETRDKVRSDSEKAERIAKYLKGIEGVKHD